MSRNAVTSGNHLAFPLSEGMFKKLRDGNFSGIGECEAIGLTKREHFAVAAMQGLLSNSTTMSGSGLIDVADKAVRMADFMIETLNDSTKR